MDSTLISDPFSACLKSATQIRTALENTYSQRAVAMEQNLTISTYSNYENGYREPPMEVIEQFCNLLGITVNGLQQLTKIVATVCETE